MKISPQKILGPTLLAAGIVCLALTLRNSNSQNPETAHLDSLRPIANKSQSEETVQCSDSNCTESECNSDKCPDTKSGLCAASSCETAPCKTPLCETTQCTQSQCETTCETTGAVCQNETKCCETGDCDSNGECAAELAASDPAELSNLSTVGQGAENEEHFSRATRLATRFDVGGATHAAVSANQESSLQEGSPTPTLADPVADEDAQPTLAIPPASEIQLPPVVVGRAAGRVQYANSLARRGATFSAEREFVGSLRMIAEAGDAQCGSNCYTQTLALALTAMEEAGDFSSHETKAMLNVKTHDIVSRHQSKAVSRHMAKQLSPMMAMQSYFEFAAERLVQASIDCPVAADSLYRLGKLHLLKRDLDPANATLNEAKAMVYFQSAIEVDPGEHRSANEMGVLLAKHGNYEEAKRWLVNCLQVQHQSGERYRPECWQNLAVVHRALGENELANMAIRESQAASSDASMVSSKIGQVKWVGQDEFAAQNKDPEMQPVARKNTAQQAPPQQRPAARTSNKDDWMFWKKIFE